MEVSWRALAIALDRLCVLWTLSCCHYFYYCNYCLCQLPVIWLSTAFSVPLTDLDSYLPFCAPFNSCSLPCRLSEKTLPKLLCLLGLTYWVVLLVSWSGAGAGSGWLTDRWSRTSQSNDTGCWILRSQREPLPSRGRPEDPPCGRPAWTSLGGSLQSKGASYWVCMSLIV